MNPVSEELSAILQSRPESVAELIDSITPAVHRTLQTAIALGKWADGTRLSRAQLEHCLEALILYEARHLPAEERTGARLKSSCGADKGGQSR